MNVTENLQHYTTYIFGTILSRHVTNRNRVNIVALQVLTVDIRRTRSRKRGHRLKDIAVYCYIRYFIFGIADWNHIVVGPRDQLHCVAQSVVKGS